VNELCVSLVCQPCARCPVCLCEVHISLVRRGVSRSYWKAKTTSRKGRESLFPCTTLLHCSLFSPFPLAYLRHLMRLAMEKIAYCKYFDWGLTDPWRRQQNDVTSVAITGGRDFRRNHIGRNAITSRTHTQRHRTTAGTRLTN
jgi:hypothetical protein